MTLWAAFPVRPSSLKSSTLSGQWVQKARGSLLQLHQLLCSLFCLHQLEHRQWKQSSGLTVCPSGLRGWTQ
eukprot:1884492-Amphidinium_carterae.1